VLRRGAIAAAIVALLGAGASSAQAQQTAKEFLKSLYDPYFYIKDYKGQPYSEHPERFFAPDLAQAIVSDMREANKRNEVPTLDGDPFLDAQDWKVAELGYSVQTNGAGTKAAGAVSFLNFDEPKGLVISLIKTPQGWRISDIVGAGGSLRALYKLK
jgi:hypothetical protein